MWLPSLIVVAALCATQTLAAVASEGGYIAADEQPSWLYETDRDTQKAENTLPEYDIDAIYDAIRQQREIEAAEQPIGIDDRILENIINEMPKQMRDYEQPENLEIDLQTPEEAYAALLKKQRESRQREPEPLVEEEPEPVKETKQTREAEPKEQVPEKEVVGSDKPLVAQKKGQSEFVSFVEPVAEAKQTKSIPSLEKRRLVTSAEYSADAPRYSSSLLMIAVGTVMMVGTVGTVVGGALYYRRRQSHPDDSEYAPYAGTGPGFKKSKKGEQGDDALAYKAQLHHYQQAKQKIICGEEGPGMVDSEGEEEVDDENNFSVYECPGLAPTGDIEVHNPNFAPQP